MALEILKTYRGGVTQALITCDKCNIQACYEGQNTAKCKPVDYYMRCDGWKREKRHINNGFTPRHYCLKCR